MPPAEDDHGNLQRPEDTAFLHSEQITTDRDRETVAVWSPQTPTAAAAKFSLLSACVGCYISLVLLSLPRANGPVFLMLAGVIS